ncbi:Gfo/Idh/MocA family oxidoreductase [Aquihabitans sp. G128]|uniref:Gfo/Idh/MocA family protein n=1 Tax=Aquihabitans sp. G128 TaxID=2849779 RepID=UPI001C224286|nr:Gfo/Idh/MocA family oxidoreductase [Aquihabitans sp. G128]QXC62407.1 Gfo/Idh/MocA family oxidoreductase [Aquihabitans sp. G128]
MSDAEGPDERIRVAVVGLGIGRMHVLAFHELRKRFRVVAVCDVDAERATEVAGWLKGVRAETDPEAIWAAGDVDVVALCTPPSQHRAQVEAALRAGKDVICEKPLVASVREVDELAAIAAETGHHVMPVFQYRFGNGLQKLLALVDQGVAGRPFVANIDLAWRRGADYYAAPWRGRWETELGGVLLGHAVHLLDMAVQVLGPPAAVWARTATLVNDIETEDSAVVTLRWANGALATLSATLGSVPELSRHRFTFEHLTAESGTDPYTNSFDPWTFTAAPGHEDAVAAVVDAHVPGTEDYIGQFERYADARANGGPLPVTLADARLMLELVTALYTSSREDREVALPLAEDDPSLAGWAP